MSRLPAWLADASLRAAAGLALLVVAGFVVLGLAWHGAARTPYVPLETPWLISGGIGGLALVGMGLGAMSIHLSRRERAQQRAAVEQLISVAAELMARPD